MQGRLFLSQAEKEGRESGAKGHDAHLFIHLHQKKKKGRSKGSNRQTFTRVTGTRFHASLSTKCDSSSCSDRLSFVACYPKRWSQLLLNLFYPAREFTYCTTSASSFSIAPEIEIWSRISLPSINFNQIHRSILVNPYSSRAIASCISLHFLPY